ncbi:hypothetical protein SHKM778_43830 [Streptomyces sp. KM77-8]|uniref:PPM-type phosphatase domain-containing protein n=1 Tax=Streptomyces haneummycinicus TaxID=3074435 RepID=A0AAT9HKP7_9ACTN
MLPDDSVGIMIGDVGGHDLRAAAAMAQTRSMLRALFYDRRTPPSGVLTQLDRTLQATAGIPVTTACLARVEPGETGWLLRWSSAGHLPPLLIGPERETEYLYAEPGLPLGVSTGEPRPDHTRELPRGPCCCSSPTGSWNTRPTPSTRAWPRSPVSPSPTSHGRCRNSCGRWRTVIPETAGTTWRSSLSASPRTARLNPSGAGRHRPPEPSRGRTSPPPERACSGLRPLAVVGPVLAACLLLPAPLRGHARLPRVVRP